MKFKNIILFLLLIAFLPSVLSSADITYNFNTNNARIVIYDCLDIGCSQVSAPWFDASTTNGQLTVSYPTTLRSSYGYASYYFSSGYIPQAYNPNWYGNGATSFNINFEKINNCYATIDNFYAINDVYANEPLQIHMKTSIGSDVRSAFTELNNGVSYIPPEFIMDHYSADTQILLQILDSNDNVVKTELRYMDRAHSNPLYMDEVRDVLFSWVPTISGDYTAQITSYVTDNQCYSNTPVSAGRVFSVLEDRPLDECYTILNNLVMSNDIPAQGDKVDFTYGKISNYMQSENNYVTLPTDLTLKIYKSGTLVNTETFSNFANTQSQNPENYGFDYTFSGSGNYQLSLTGIADSPICQGKVNTPDTTYLNLYIDEPRNTAPVLNHIGDKTVYEGEELTFQVSASDADNDVLSLFAQNLPSGASFNDNGDGQATFTWTPSFFQAGSYQVRFIANDGTEIDDETITITVLNNNRAPTLSPIGDKIVSETETLSFNVYAIDSDGDQLTYSANNLPNGTSFTNSGAFTWTPTLEQAGLYQVTFIVSDGSLTDSETIQITVKNVCVEAWKKDVNSCLSNNLKLITYTDLNNCGTTDDYPINGGTYELCDFCTPNIVNTTWSDWSDNTGCQADNTKEQVRTFTQYDSNSCGEVADVIFTEYRDVPCDFCTPSLSNTSWSAWSDVGVCQSDNTQMQSRYLTQYDSNSCGEVADVIFTEYRDVPCDFCTPNLIYSDWSVWSDVGECLSSNLQEESRSRTLFDSNYCGEVPSQTFTESRFVPCDFCTPSLVNTSWSVWVDSSSCESGDTKEQTRTLTQFDANVCGEVNNVTFTETRNVNCDFCTPSLVNTSWSAWSDVGDCRIDNSKVQLRTLTQFDSNSCGEVADVVFTEYRDVPCDFCTPELVNTSWSVWVDSSSCESGDTKEQTRTLTQFDANVCGEVNNVTFTETRNVNCDFCTPSLVNTSWSAWSDVGDCRIDNSKVQLRTLTQFDSNSCGEVADVVFTEYRDVPCDFCTPNWVEDSNACQTDNNRLISYTDLNSCGESQDLPVDNGTYTNCDFCTPNMTLLDWTTWSDAGVCLSDDTKEQSRSRTLFDVNACGEIPSQTFVETRFVVCDFCTPNLVNAAWSTWNNVSVCLPDNTQEQSRSSIQYDANVCGEVANQSIVESRFISCTFSDDFSVKIVANPTSGTAPLEISFSTIIVDGIAPFTYYWDFGDGKRAYTANPKHTYNIGGDYKVILYVTDAYGRVRTDTKNMRLGLSTVGTTSKSQLFLSAQIIEDESIILGEELRILTTVKNTYSKSFKDVRVIVSLPELGEMRTYRLGTLSVGETETQEFILTVPEYASQGENMARISIYTDGGNVIRNKYLYFNVI